MATAPQPPPESASPALAEGLATAVTAVYGEAETAIILTISTSVRAALEAADPMAAMLARSADTQGAVRRIVDRMDAAARRAVPRALSEAYGRGHGVERRAVESAVRSALDRLAALRAGVLRWVTQLWNRLIGAMGTRSFSASPGNDADLARRTADLILQRAAGRGIDAYQDTRGRRWGLTSYVDQAVQHAAGNAAMDGYLDRISEAGGDLVIVTRSPHPCPICRPWEGRVLSVSGDGRHPSMATAREAGLWHPNCHHTIYAWRPGFRWPPHALEHRPGTYDATQRQRAIERHIREWRRRQVAALDDTTRLAAARKVRYWQAELRQHVAANGLRRSRQRERTDYGHTRPLKHALGG